jgi:hypothetical protein
MDTCGRNLAGVRLRKDVSFGEADSEAFRARADDDDLQQTLHTPRI